MYAFTISASGWIRTVVALSGHRPLDQIAEYGKQKFEVAKKLTLSFEWLSYFYNEKTCTSQRYHSFTS